MLEPLASFLFLLAVIDPLGSIPVFLEATRQSTNREKKGTALRASLMAGLILLFFMGAGQFLREAMNVSPAMLQVSGGTVVFLCALTQVFGKGRPESEKRLLKDCNNTTLFPLAFPSIASPRLVMAAIVLTEKNQGSLQGQAGATLNVQIALGVTCLLLLAAGSVQKRIGEPVIRVISKMMGLVTASFAIQCFLAGTRGYLTL